MSYYIGGSVGTRETYSFCSAFHSQTQHGLKDAVPSPPSPATNLHFLLAYSPRRFLPASAVPFGDITLVLSAASNFLVEQSQMSGEAGTEHSKVDLHGQGEGRICSLCSLSHIC